MTSLADLEKQLRTLLGASAQFYPGKAAALNDFYEAYLWAETVNVARANAWTVSYANAGAAGDEFTFRCGPGLLTSKTKYTYAVLNDGRFRKGELHIGIRVAGCSGVLHEFDVVALNEREATLARTAGAQPDQAATRLHMEAKFHTADLSLGVARSIVGLQADCPAIHGFLVSRGKGSPTLRQLIKCYGGTYVHNAVPTGTGVAYLHTCLGAALATWKP
jgi:hypothetical protein